MHNSEVNDIRKPAFKDTLFGKWFKQVLELGTAFFEIRQQL